MNSVRVAVSGTPGHEAAAAELAAALALPQAAEAELLLYLTGERLELRETGRGAAGPIYIDFVSGRADYRRKHGGGRGQALARAVGFRGGVPPNVADATAGLGQDAFVLASLGARVTLLERSPVVGALLADALRRAAESADVAPIASRMTLVVANAAEHLTALSPPPEVVYLDPMYPHLGKRALQKKEMRLFRLLVGGDEDAGRLLQAAQAVAQRRVVVKRPRGAPFLADRKPDAQLESKNTRFDLYFP